MTCFIVETFFTRNRTPCSIKGSQPSDTNDAGATINIITHPERPATFKLKCHCNSICECVCVCVHVTPFSIWKNIKSCQGGGRRKIKLRGNIYSWAHVCLQPHKPTHRYRWRGVIQRSHVTARSVKDRKMVDCVPKGHSVYAQAQATKRDWVYYG